MWKLKRKMKVPSEPPITPAIRTLEKLIVPDNSEPVEAFESLFYYLGQAVCEYNGKIDTPEITEEVMLYWQMVYAPGVARLCKVLLAHEGYPESRKKEKESILNSMLWWTAVEANLKEKGVLK